jgi:hypothetical protein
VLLNFKTLANQSFDPKYIEKQQQNKKLSCIGGGFQMQPQKLALHAG